MGRKIKMVRGNKSDLPALDVAEIGFTVDTKETFIGSGDGNIRIADDKDVGLLNSRIDTIVATAGDGTIPSELSDIRVGENGTTYGSAGESVRGQLSEIKNQIALKNGQNELKFEQVDSQLADIMTYKKPDNIFNKSGLLDNTLITITGALETSEGYSTSYFLPVEEGKTVYFSANGIKQYEALTVYFNENMQQIGYATGWQYTLTIPQGAKLMRVSMQTIHVTKYAINYDEIKPYSDYFEPFYELSGQSELIAVQKKVNFLDTGIKRLNDITHTPTRSAVVTFIADDAFLADYTKLKPLSETYEIPFVIAVPATTYTMTIDQMLDTQNRLGWEYASHTYNHIDLSTLATEAEIEYQLKASKDFMNENGIKCNNLVYPYGGHDERVRRIAKKYFRCAPTTGRGINAGVIPSFALKRIALGSFYQAGTLEEYKSFVDQAVTQNAWLIFMLHPANAQHDATQQTYLEQTIQYIKSLNIPIVTLDQGYDRFGNALEIGDYIGTVGQGMAISGTGEKANF